MSSSFCQKTTLLWLRLLTCWQSGSFKWVGIRIKWVATQFNSSVYCKCNAKFSVLYDYYIIYIIITTISSGVEPAQVQERVENHLKSLLIKHFDPQKADSIFTVEGEVRDFSLNHEHLVKKKGQTILDVKLSAGKTVSF